MSQQFDSDNVAVLIRRTPDSIATDRWGTCVLQRNNLGISWKQTKKKNLDKIIQMNDNPPFVSLRADITPFHINQARGLSVEVVEKRH